MKTNVLSRFFISTFLACGVIHCTMSAANAGVGVRSPGCILQADGEEGVQLDIITGIDDCDEAEFVYGTYPVEDLCNFLPCRETRPPIEDYEFPSTEPDPADFMVNSGESGYLLDEVTGVEVPEHSPVEPAEDEPSYAE